MAGFKLRYVVPLALGASLLIPMQLERSKYESAHATISQSTLMEKASYDKQVSSLDKSIADQADLLKYSENALKETLKDRSAALSGYNKSITQKNECLEEKTRTDTLLSKVQEEHNSQLYKLMSLEYAPEKLADSLCVLQEKHDVEKQEVEYKRELLTELSKPVPYVVHFPTQTISGEMLLNQGNGYWGVSYDLKKDLTDKVFVNLDASGFIPFPSGVNSPVSIGMGLGYRPTDRLMIKAIPEKFFEIGSYPKTVFDSKKGVALEASYFVGQDDFVPTIGVHLMNDKPVYTLKIGINLNKK